MSKPRSDLLAGWRAPSAPPSLRERALAAARDPAAAPIPRRIEDRIWDSHPLRLGWLAAAAVLVVLNLALQDRGASPKAPVTVVAAGPVIDEDVGIEIPSAPDEGMTLAEAYQLAVELLNDPCLESWNEGDCT